MSEDVDAAGQGVLTGIRVLDLTTVIMGPYATQILGDLGAEIIKVESGRGDTNRFMGGGPHPELSGIALNINRNKRAVSLDLKHPSGIEVFHRLLEMCDVFVTNLRAGPLARLGLSYDDLKARYPKLIYCQAAGFKSGTAEENRPAYDDIIQAAAGLPPLSVRTTGKTSFFPSIIADKVAGQTVVAAILAALFHKERTGCGQRVEVPMFNAVLAFNLVEHLSRAAVEGGESGYSRIMTTTRGPHRTQDGYVAIMPYTDAHWQSLFGAVGSEYLLKEPWFADHSSRLLNAEQVYSELAKIVSKRTTAEWLALCNEHGIPANPVPTIDEIVSDPTLHRDMIQEAEHPVIGPFRQIGPSFVMSETPLSVRRPAPLLAEHTAEVLREVGYSNEEIEALVEAGAAAIRDNDDLARDSGRAIQSSSNR